MSHPQSFSENFWTFELNPELNTGTGISFESHRKNLKKSLLALLVPVFHIVIVERPAS